MKNFKVLIDVQAENKMTAEDFNLFPDDVIDGHTLSRNSRLGDITTDFFINSASRDFTEEIKSGGAEFEIKISGSGTKAAIFDALMSVAFEMMQDWNAEETNLEDAILITEISKVETV